MARLDYKAINEAADMRDVLAALGIESHHGKALCPFHDDRNPSMQIYADGYHCFVCGAHGDAIDLVQHVRGCSRREAAKEVAYIAGATIIEATAESRQRESDRKRRESQYDDDVIRLLELDDAIEQTRAVCYNTSPYSALWIAAYRRLDTLMREREETDARVLDEANRRYERKHEHIGGKKGRNSEVLRSGGVCADRGDKQRI
jgi:hypothetical protein